MLNDSNQQHKYEWWDNIGQNGFGNVGRKIAVRTEEHQLGNKIILFELYRREKTFNSTKVTFPFGIY